VRIETFIRGGLGPALALLPPELDSAEARTLVLAICLQESGLSRRRQVVRRSGRLVADGPAIGYAQFELTGVRGVLLHPVSHDPARSLCFELDVDPTAAEVHAAMEHCDALAAGFARLLLYTEPAPLPSPLAVEEAWLYYLRCWRPGKPRRDDWPGNLALARGAIGQP
jgi:hypothetical protein